MFGLDCDGCASPASSWLFQVDRPAAGILAILALCLWCALELTGAPDPLAIVRARRESTEALRTHLRAVARSRQARPPEPAARVRLRDSCGSVAGGRTSQATHSLNADRRSS